METDALLAALGARTRQLRQDRGLTLRALAERSGVSIRFLLDVEAGRANISVRRLADLAAALSSSAADLLAARASASPARPIALLGLRGAGKTSIGQRLARRRHAEFVELDRRIEERAGLALGEIFSLHGEEFYRRVEHDALTEVLGERAPLVVAVGGGLVASPDTYALLRRGATTVWLRARAEDYWSRVVKQGDRRPIDAHPQARQALRALIARRNPLYRRADVAVDTAGLTVAQAVARVERALAERG